MHDSIRHSTTTLDLATGKVIGRCSKQHQHQEFLLLRRIDRETPSDLGIHRVMDNTLRTSTPKCVHGWLNDPDTRSISLRTSASWMNLVERWLSLISQRAIKRGLFWNVTVLVKTIDEFIEHYNETAKPFVWVATAESIFGKFERLTTHISGTLD